MHWCSFGVLVVCWAKIVTSLKWVDGDIRLVGGSRKYMGTVVIFHNGKWGGVCDGMWDMKDATVVCRQLGYTLAVRSATRSEFGPGNKRFWLSQVRCNGREERLDECPFLGFDENTRSKCLGRYRSAGVICSAAILPTTSEMSLPSKEVISSKGEKDAAMLTSVEVAERGHIQNDSNVKEINSTTEPTVTTLANQLETSTTAAVIQTRIMISEIPTFEADNQTESTTYNSSTRTAANSTLQTYNPITDPTPTLLHLSPTVKAEHVESSDNASTQENKLHSIIPKEEHISDNITSDNSLQDVDVALSHCNTTSQNKNKEGCEIYFADEPKLENIEVRLNGGRYNFEGHVQVRINGGKWGTICSDHWTLREAMVTCNQLGEHGKAKQALLTSYFGGTTVPNTLYRVECVGRESTFSLCNYTLTDKTHTCSMKSSIAGVVCSHHLPDLVPSLKGIEGSIRLQDQPLYYLRCAMEENCLASSAYVIKNTTLSWRNSMRRLLRFSTIVHNRGLADFRPYKPRGLWEWHACHMHYHSMEVFAHYDILDSNGKRLAEGSKASFCLEDTTCDKGIKPQYNCRGFADQGLSVNCSDNYMYDIDCQWIDISDIKPGEYTFLMAVNPSMLVAESDFDNNIVSCRLYYSGYFASVQNCHYDSLLDYREAGRLPF
uniref:protein-lysine 6-oxidase n=1 Tax=Arion vulgaris TaxID=1028688 RepID=A0A0B6Z7H0_9EUPU